MQVFQECLFIALLLQGRFFSLFYQEKFYNFKILLNICSRLETVNITAYLHTLTKTKW